MTVLIVSNGFVAIDNDSVEVATTGFVDVSDDIIDSDVEGCVEIDSENIIIRVESNEDDDAAIVSDTTAGIFVVDSVDVILCDDSTDGNVSGVANLAEDDCIAIVSIDSIFDCGGGIRCDKCAAIEVVTGVNPADKIFVSGIVASVTTVSVFDSASSFKLKPPVLNTKLIVSAIDEVGIVVVECSVEVVIK